MASYSEADIAKLINDCEILILPEDCTIENAIGDENQQLLPVAQIQGCSDDRFGETEEEEFERIFQQSKQNINHHLVS
jgi:hypothetical protein